MKKEVIIKGEKYLFTNECLSLFAAAIINQAIKDYNRGRKSEVESFLRSSWGSMISECAGLGEYGAVTVLRNLEKRVI